MAAEECIVRLCVNHINTTKVTGIDVKKLSGFDECKVCKDISKAEEFRRKHTPHVNCEICGGSFEMELQVNDSDLLGREMGNGCRIRRWVPIAAGEYLETHSEVGKFICEGCLRRP